jgi:hypothetical protein
MTRYPPSAAAKPLPLCTAYRPCPRLSLSTALPTSFAVDLGACACSQFRRKLLPKLLPTPADLS